MSFQLQEEKLFELDRNLTEMEAVRIQLEAHRELVVGIHKGLEKLSAKLNMSEKDKLTDEAEVRIVEILRRSRKFWVTVSYRYHHTRAHLICPSLLY